MDADETRLWKLLSYVTDRLRECREEEMRSEFIEEAFNLTINQTRAIRVVHDLEMQGGQKVTLKLLSEKLRITSAAASEMVETLVRKEVLSRVQDPQDRRAVIITLSEVAWGFIRRRYEQFDRTGRSLLAELTVEERKEIFTILEKFQDNLRQGPEPCY